LEVKPPKSGLVLSVNVREAAPGYSTEEEPFLLTTGLRQDANDYGKAPTARVCCYRATPRGLTDPSPYASADPINLLAENDLPSGDLSGVEPLRVDPVSQPTGISFSTYRISPTGVVTATVWPADGSAPVTVATRICEQSGGANFFTYFPIANSSGKSSLIGDNLVDLDGYAGGLYTWFKNASNSGSSYPGGIALQEDLRFSGSRFVAQPAGLNLFGLKESITNAELDLLGADLDVDVSVPLTLSSKAIKLAPKAEAAAAMVEQKVTATSSSGGKVATAPVASKVNMRYDGKTGILTGSLNLNGGAAAKSRAVTFRGMLAPDGKSVMGHFTIPAADAKKKRIYAGELRVQPMN